MDNIEHIQTELRNYLTDVPKKYRDGNYLFAYFASFATVFSPDMLYQLWLNFKEYHKDNQLQEIHIVAISDLLQSNLCYKIGYELYEMEEDITQYLQKLTPEELLEKRKIKIAINIKYKLAAFTIEFSKKYLKNKQRNLNLFNYYYWSNIWMINPNEAKNSIINLIQSDLSKHVVNNILEIALDVLINDTKTTKAGFNKIPQLSTEAKGKFQELSFLKEQKPEYWKKLVKFLKIDINYIQKKTNDNKPKEIVEIESILKNTLIKVSSKKYLFYYKNPCYILNEFNDIIGLNLSNCNIVDVDFLKDYRALEILVLNNTLVTHLELYISPKIKIHNVFTGDGIYVYNCPFVSKYTKLTQKELHNQLNRLRIDILTEFVNIENSIQNYAIHKAREFYDKLFLSKELNYLLFRIKSFTKEIKDDERRSLRKHEIKEEIPYIFEYVNVIQHNPDINIQKAYNNLHELLSKELFHKDCVLSLIYINEQFYTLLKLLKS